MKGLLTLRHYGTTEQRTFWNSRAKYRAFVGGIGSGKTRAGCVEILRQPARSVGMVIAPTYPMLRDATFATFALLAKRGDVLASFNVSTNIATLIDGKQVTFRSADKPDSLRGPNLDWFYMDEAAMCKEEAWLIMIARLRGSGNIGKDNLRGWLTTTPRGRNWVWSKFAQSRAAEYEIIRASTKTNTYLPADFVANVKASYSEQWQKQELDGEFVEGNGGVFRRVRQCATATPQDRPIPGHVYVFGIDWARSNDYTVITVMDATLMSVVHVDRFSDIDYHTQTNRLIALYERFMPTAIYSEANSMGGPLTEDLQMRGLPVYRFDTTAQTKPAIIQALELAFERETLHIIPDEVLINELESYEQERTTTGIRYGAPAGQHDDCVMSLAIAWHACGRMGSIFQ